MTRGCRRQGGAGEEELGILSWMKIYLHLVYKNLTVLFKATAACSTHMHHGVVGLFAGVKKEVERPSVLSPLDGFKYREDDQLRSSAHLQLQNHQVHRLHTFLLWK